MRATARRSIRLVATRIRLVAFVLVAGPAAAQSAATARWSPDPQTHRVVVDTIAVQLRRHYVDADTGQLIAEYILRRAATGTYDTITDPYRLAARLTADLGTVNHDGHLSVHYAPDMPTYPVGPEGLKLGGPPGPLPPEVVEEERSAHYGIARLDVLPGNVGYMDLRSFPESPAAYDAIVNALRYLEPTDAIIIDLRRNGGGSGEMSNFLISHFVGPDSTLSLRVINRSGHEQIDRWTLGKVPGPRRPTVPLFLLTCRATGSAAEDFAFVLSNLGRATVVGDRTYGAGHNNAFLASGYGFVTSISFTRVMDPRTGKEWEGVGVRPTLPAEPEQALLVAHATAVERLAASATGPRRKEYMAIHEALEAELHPRVVPPLMLERYTGRYSGGQSIAFVDGRLAFRPRAGFLSEPLVAIGDSVFARHASDRIIFAHDAAGAVVMSVVTLNQGTLSFRRIDGEAETPAG
jgi:hypothetical protein